MRGWTGVVRGVRLVGLLLLLLPAACAHRLSAAQIAVLKQEGFAPQPDETWQLSLGDKMLFETGSDALNPQTRTAIEHTGASLGTVGIRNVKVEGHTDNVGADDYNLALSQRRAQAVAKALDQQGMAPIGVVGKGKTQPVADNATADGRAENRRVAVIVPDNQE